MGMFVANNSPNTHIQTIHAIGCIDLCGILIFYLPSNFSQVTVDNRRLSSLYPIKQSDNQFIVLVIISQKTDNQVIQL